MSYQRRVEFSVAIEAYSIALTTWDRVQMDPNASQFTRDFSTDMYTGARKALFDLVAKVTPVDEVGGFIQDASAGQPDRPESTAEGDVGNSTFSSFYARTGPNNTSVKSPFIVNIRR